MTCDEVLARLSDYLDGTLDGATAEGLREHMATCGNCRIVLDTTHSTIALLRRAATPALPERSRQRLLQQLRQRFDGEAPSPAEDGA
jgi:anti-sigma factor (TIGR02949 family)